MTANGVVQLVLYLVVLLALVKPLGLYMARVYQGQAIWLDRPLGWLERLIYRAAGVRPDAEHSWKAYTLAMLLFNFVGILVVYALQRLQGVLPLNPMGLGAVSPDSSFNTAVSFGTNTNWQGYGGETTMSYLTQMLGLTVQNFVSAAAGMATLAAFVRGLTRRSARHDRQLLGRSHADHAVHPAPALGRPGPGAGLPGRGADVRAVREGGRRPADRVRGAGDGCRRQAGPGRQGTGQDEEVHPDRASGGPRSGRVPGRHQTAGHQWRRVLQCQLGTPAGEPDPGVELAGAPGHPRHRGGPLLHVRGHGRRHPAGLGRAGRHDGHVRRPPDSLRGRRAAWPHAGLAGRRSPGQRPPGRRQHGGQGGALRHRPLRPVGHRHHGGLQRLRQRHARLVHPAGGAGAHVAHAARRGHVRRGGLGPLRDAGLRHHRGVRGRTDGRADPGVPRQEDRSLRDEDGRPGHPDPAGRGDCSAPPSPW